MFYISRYDGRGRVWVYDTEDCTEECISRQALNEALCRGIHIEGAKLGEEPNLAVATDPKHLLIDGVAVLVRNGCIVHLEPKVAGKTIVLSRYGKKITCCLAGGFDLGCTFVLDDGIVFSRGFISSLAGTLKLDIRGLSDGNAERVYSGAFAKGWFRDLLWFDGIIDHHERQHYWYTMYTLLGRCSFSFMKSFGYNALNIKAEADFLEVNTEVLESLSDECLTCRGVPGKLFSRTSSMFRMTELLTRMHMTRPVAALLIGAQDCGCKDARVVRAYSNIERIMDEAHERGRR